MKPLSRRSLAAHIALAAAILISGNARTYSVATGGTDPCHEKITGRAYDGAFLQAANPSISLPRDDTWRHLIEDLCKWAGIDPDEVDENRSFILVSLLIGSRAPDTEGHSLLNLKDLRKIHADPGAMGQYAHCLRGTEDDYEEGNAAAVAGARQVILELVKEAQYTLSLSPQDQLIKKDLYLDFYGLIDVTVWAPAYYLGRAAHAVEDSFSHTIRSDDDELKKVVHVMNYIDAISYGFDEDRDGLAHSDGFDECNDPELSVIVDAAVEATADLFAAADQQLSGLDSEATLHHLDRWLTLKPGCTRDNGFCGNEHWVEIARREQTGPYLKALFGCSSAGPLPAKGWGLGLGAILGLVALLV